MNVMCSYTEQHSAGTSAGTNSCTNSRILDTILNRLAVQLEKQDKLAKQLRGAMVYPATISVVAVACIVLLLVKVIPVFQKMFEDFGGELPGPTAMVIAM